MITAKHVRARICATKEPSGAIIDINDVANVTLKEVENYGANGKLTIINKGIEDPTKNLLSESCTLWNDGQPRAIKPGMFLRLYENERTSPNALGVFFISSIQAVGETITVEFGDCLRLLKSMGADYVRNHYDAGGLKWHNSRAIWDDINNRGYVEKPASVEVPSTGAVRMYINATRSVPEQSTTTYSFSMNKSVKCKIPTSIFIESGARYLQQIKDLKVNYQGGFYEQTVTVKIGTSEGAADLQNETFRIGGGIHTWTSKTFNGMADLTQFQYLWIELRSDNLIATFVCDGELNGAEIIADPSGGYNRAFTMNIIVQRLRTNVVGQTSTENPGQWIIQTIDGSPATSDDCQGWLGQAQVYYVEESAKVTASSIIQNILADAGMELNQSRIPITRGINTFRCNGDYYHNYILALCDMPNDNGQQFTITAERDTWGRLIMGYRYRVDNPDTADSPRYSFFYSKDAPEIPMDTDVIFESFNPSVTLKDKPRISVIKGTTNAERPIMVAIMDPEIAIGASNPSVSGSVTSAVEAGLAAYKNIITNRSKNWAGTITVPGIDRRFFMTSSDFGMGGVPIEITDHRYGMNRQIARVKEVEYDFHNQTTTLTINNYSEIYSNGLVDTEKMAYTAGDLSSAATTDDMFNRQFVSVRVEEQLPEPISIIYIRGADFEEHLEPAGENDDHITIIKFPELKIAVLNAYFAAGAECPHQYGVERIQVNDGAEIIIPEPRRPDKKASQSLIVNLIYNYEE